MLINLSNHPSSKWGEAQRNTAWQQFGDIQDMPFPNITPDWDTDEVETHAGEFYGRIKEIEIEIGEKPVIHITGEITFCFLLIQMLLNDGFRCITSTTERIVKEENGIKTSEFKFKRFRNYIIITP